MRQTFCDIVEAGRDLTHPRFATARGDRCGAFRLRHPKTGATLLVIASDASDWEAHALPLPRWEHVSVSLPGRCPTWEEMRWVKALFFENSECVVQFHPPEESYVNFHPHCLHLWRVAAGFPMPPLQCV